MPDESRMVLVPEAELGELRDLALAMLARLPRPGAPVHALRLDADRPMCRVPGRVLLATDPELVTCGTCRAVPDWDVWVWRRLVDELVDAHLTWGAP